MADRRTDENGIVTLELDVAETACGACGLLPGHGCKHTPEQRARLNPLLVLAKPYFDRLSWWWRRWRRG